MKTIFFSIFYLFLTICTVNAQTLLWTEKSNDLVGLATYGVAFSKNGQRVLSGSECHPANIRMFDASNGQLLWNYNVGHQFMCIQSVTFSSNGNYIASVEEFGNILIFDNTGTLPVIQDTIKTGTSYAFAAEFSPNDERLVVAASNGKVNIYQVQDKILIKSIPAHTGYVFATAWSADGSMIATGGSDNKLKIWNPDGILIHQYTGNLDDINSIRFSPDNLYVVTGGADGKVIYRSVSDGSVVLTFQAHLQDIKQVDISADGKKILTASYDGTCKIWDASNGNLLGSFGEASNGVMWSARWSPDMQRIVTGTGNGDVVMWDVSQVSAAHEAESQEPAVQIFPNPASQWFTLLSETQKEVVSVTLYDLNGSCVQSFKKPAKMFALHGIVNGLYHVKVIFKEGKTLSFPLVVLN